MSIAAAAISSICSKNSEQEPAVDFSSDDKFNKYDCTFKNCFGTFTSFSEFFQNVLASYSRIINPDNLSAVSLIKLANAGFVLLDEDLLVKCYGCDKIVKICDFDTETSPSDQKYHVPGCRFVQAEGYNEEQTDEVNSALDSQSLDSVSGATGIDYLPSHEIASDTSLPSLGYVPGVTGNTHASLQNELHSLRLQLNLPEVDSAYFSDDTSQERYDPESVSAPDVKACDQRFDNDMNVKTNPTSSLLQDVKGFLSQKGKFISEASGQSGINVDVNAEFDDSEYFLSEYEDLNQEAKTCKENCKKNPGHYGFLPTWNLKLDHIPSKVRHADVLRFFKLLADITVRIVVGTTSKDRAKSYVVENGQNGRIGTGYAFSKPESNYNIPDAGKTGYNGKWRAFKEYCHIVRHKDHIYIRTNRHLVYDETEAQSVTVEFFYDHPNRKGIVFAKGVSICHSPVVGNLESILVCKTADMSLVKMVSDSTNEIETLAKNFPRNIKEEMMKRVFLIGHTHGGEKMFSCGEYVMIKFEIKQQNVNDHIATRIVKINNHTQISNNSDNIRKALLYTTEACAGCTGAPVVAFVKTRNGDTEDIVLDIWMHMGLDRTNRLSGSILRELTSEDIANHGHTIIYRPSVQDDMIAEADSAANQVVSCPVYTVAKPPAHPAYVAYIKRLDSYPNPFTHVHTAPDLADCGFFYAGYEDCVRCFHCGLGLKSWKAGDNIHEEHERNRPDCQFLQLKLREAGIPALTLQSNCEQSAAVGSPFSLVSSELAVMEMEQSHLKQMLTCKVCLQKPIKDLFLPCGELVACIDCSKLLTHCPSCNKRILATVTTYFI